MYKIVESSYEEYLKNDPRGLKAKDSYSNYFCFFCKKNIADARVAVWCRIQYMLFGDTYILCSKECRNLWILSRINNE